MTPSVSPQSHKTGQKSIMLLVIALLFVFPGCHKDNTTYLPSTTPDDPYTHGDNPLIQQQPLSFLVPNAEPNGFLPRYIAGIGPRISSTPQPNTPQVQGIEMVVKIIAQIMSTKSNFTKKKNFKELTENVKSLILMEQQVLQSIQDLQNQLKLTQVEILNYIATLTVNTYITSIETAYSTTSPQGLLYFSQYASDIQEGIRPASDTNLLREQTQVYISSIYEQHNPDIVNLIAQINGQICPVIGGTSQSVLNQYTNHILLDPASNFNNQEVHKAENILKSYLLLENYFMHLINAQFKGLIIMGNIYNQIDTTGYVYKSYLEGTFRSFMQEQTAMFQLMTDRLAVNLVDYRNMDRFSDAVRSLEFGLSPDSLHRNMLARSRFISGIILQTVGVEPPGYGAAILLPSRYNTSFSLNPSSLNLQHNGTPVKAEASAFNNTPGIPGVFPYTMWTDTLTLAPDNLWYLYSTSIPMSQINPGSNQVSLSPLPWTGTGLVTTNAITGEYTALYYNPFNPDPKKATPQPTDSNTYLFGFSAASWQFGDLLTCKPATRSTRIPFMSRINPQKQFYANPVSQYIPSSGKWQELGYTPAYRPEAGSRDKICFTSFDPQKTFTPIPEGFKMALINGTSSYVNLTTQPGGSSVRFLFIANTIAQNTTGSGNTPCPYQVVVFYGGTGSVSQYTNAPSNLFYKESGDLATGDWEQMKVSAGPWHYPASETVWFTFVSELGISGAAPKPKYYTNVLPLVQMEVFGQFVYEGEYDIF